jgi:hypothetical protein
MEINYDLIIKYLVTKKTTFASKKHILVYSDLFPEKFKDFFQNKFYRYGINQTNSFYVSLLTLLNKHFITSTHDDEKYESEDYEPSRYITAVSQPVNGIGERITSVLSREQMNPESHYYLCGNRQMITDTVQILRERGVPGGRILMETFF